MMKILVAPDSFKNSLRADQVSACIEKGIKRAVPDAEVITVPLSDGGEGLIDSLVKQTNGPRYNVQVHDPLGRKIFAAYGAIEKTAIIEMAAASGIELLAQNELNPLVSNTYGTGELIKDALDKGYKRIILGIGGSATNDAGTGMAMALGVRFYDDKGKQVRPSGENLGLIKHVDFSELDKRLERCEIIAACDVNNPLIGPMGSSHTYSPQKGATNEDVDILEENMIRFSKVLNEIVGNDISKMPGAGAAGGMGAGIISFLKGKLKSGFNIVSSLTHLHEEVESSDLVITGEGKVDGQSMSGKVISGLSKLCLPSGKPLIVLAGNIEGDLSKLYDQGITSVFTIVPGPMTLEEAMRNAPALITDAAERTIRLFLKSTG